MRVLFFVLFCRALFSEPGESCCKSEFVLLEDDIQRVQQCGCLFYTETECEDESLGGQCLWDRDFEIQADCMISHTQNRCEKHSNCYWYKDLLDAGSCRSMLCKEKECSDLVKKNSCALRNDCQWVEQYGICARELSCSCQDPRQLDKFCPCLKKKNQCDANWGCIWSNALGCRKK